MSAAEAAGAGEVVAASDEVIGVATVVAVIAAAAAGIDSIACYVVGAAV